MPVEAENQHPNHPYRVRGSRPLPISLPDNKVDRAYLEWIRTRFTAERVIEELDFNEQILLSDLYKAFTTPDSDDAFTRSQRASYERTLLLRAIKLGAPRTIEFMAIPEGFQTYLLWLSGKYPRLNWEPVFQTFYREPVTPQRTGKPLMGEWNLTEEQELLLTLRIHADLIPATGKPWGGYRVLDSYDDDSHERIESMMESLKATHDCNPVKVIEFNLPQLRERANYYSTHIDKLSLHSLLFDPMVDPFEDSELTNQPGFSMSDLLTVESYYEGEIEKLTGERYVVSVDPATGMNPGNTITFGGIEDTQNPDPKKDTKQSTPEEKQKPQKAIANTGENPGNTITFEASEDTQTPDPEKDTKWSIPEEKQEPQKAIEKPVKTVSYDWDKLVWTRNQVASYLGITPDTVSRWVKQEKFPGTPLPNGGYRFYKTEVETWEQTQRQQGVHSTTGETPQWRDDNLPFAF